MQRRYDNRRSAFDECGHVISFDCLDSTRKDVILLFDVYGLLIAGHLGPDSQKFLSQT